MIGMYCSGICSTYGRIKRPGIQAKLRIAITTATIPVSIPSMGAAKAYPMSVSSLGRRIFCPLCRGKSFSNGTTITKRKMIMKIASVERYNAPAIKRRARKRKNIATLRPLVVVFSPSPIRGLYEDIA